MGFISDVVNRHITDYNLHKTGEWTKAEPPPANIFSLDEIYCIGRGIISELEGKLSDKYFK